MRKFLLEFYWSYSRVGTIFLALATMLLCLDSAHAQSCSTNPITAENCLAGNPQSEWDIVGAGDPSIQGFADDISVNRGDLLSFKIDTDASGYQLDIYRLGYYGGLGARKVATVLPSVPLPQNQPTCLTQPTTGLVDCGNWSVSAEWTIPPDATSGIYIARATRDDTGGASHIVFIVRNDSSTSDLLFKTSDTTWQAYNDYGGNSLYTGAPAGRAYAVSYNRPFVTRGSQYSRAWLFGAEYPMVRWLEENGYDVSYISSVDADRSGQQIQNHKSLLAVGHDEYWSAAERSNVEAARDAGVHLAFFTGNGMFWKVRWEASIEGSSTPYRTLVSYKETLANAKIDPDASWTGTWRDPRFSPPSDGGNAENALTGTIFTVNCCESIGIQVPAEEGKLRFWRNTSIAELAAGEVATLAAGTLGYEWDEDLDNGFRPAGLFRMSSTTVQGAQRLQDYGSSYAPDTATHSLTFYRHDSGALVFGAGTIRWSWGLDVFHDFDEATPNVATVPDARMQQATVNLFADMGIQAGSLQPGIQQSFGSTDSMSPTSTIIQPQSNSTVEVGQTFVISGTATDFGGGRPAGVEVSVDGGTTWRRADGRDNWTYLWTPETEGSATLMSRAVDDSGNLGVPSSSVAVLIDEQSCPCSVWSAATVPAVPAAPDSDAVELGVKFRAATDGYVTGIRFYKGAGNTGQHEGSLWTESGTLLATATFTSETATGWQQVDFASPVPVTANTIYVASYYAPNGHYSFDGGFFANSGVDTGLLYLLQDGENGGNGVFAYGPASAFPANSYNASNYYVDVVFTDNTAALVVAPDVVAMTQTNAEAALTTAGLTVGTVTRAYSGTVPLDSVISQDPAGGTLVPDGSAVDLVVSDGPAPPDGTPPTVPTGLSATVVGPYQVDLSWTASTDGESGVGGYRVYVDGTDSGVTTATTFSVTGLAANTSYSFTVSAFDNAVPPNPSAQSNGVSATTDVDGQACPCSVWDATTVPAVPAAPDSDAVELGVKFRAATDGYVTGIRFYKGAGNTGQHEGSLWTESGTLLATATFTSETATGWQQVDFASPVPVTANTIYVASYYAPNGHYSFDGSFFANSGVDTGLLYMLQDGENGGNGVFAYGPTSAFPANSYNASNYYVDVVFSDNTGAFVVAPDVVAMTQTNAEAALTTAGLTVGTVTRAYSGTVPLDSVISQDPDGGTLVPDGSAVDLVVSDGPAPPDGTPPTVPTGLSATVVGPYQVDLSWTASTDGESGVGGYRVYVDGTDSGVTTATTFSVTGLAANTSYSFTVSAFDNAVPPNPSAQSNGVSATTDVDGQACPCSVWDATTVPAVPASPDGTAYELGVRFRAATDGYVTGIRFYKGAGNTGEHVGNLWTESGTLLATAIFTSETATGWQQVDFASPVPVTANTIYVASYLAPNGHFSYDGGFFANSGVDTGLLYMLQDGENGGNGVFAFGPTSAFPDQTYNATNYYVDVVFTDNTGAFVVAPDVVAMTQTNAEAALTTAGLTVGTVTRAYSGTVPLDSVISQDPDGGTLVPDGSAVDLVVSDGPAPPDGTPPTVPTGLSATVVGPYQVDLSWTASTDGESGVGGYRVYVDGTDSGVTTATTFSVTGLAANTSYSFTVSAFDNAVPPNPSAQSNGVSATTDVDGQTCPCSVWDATTVPAVPAAPDSDAVELGVKFRAATDGYVTGIRFYKGAGNTGQHEGSLWTESGTLLATATFTSETATGWQQVDFASPVPITANTIYVASYYAPNGHYSFDGSFFANSGVDTGLLYMLQDGENGGNGVFAYGPASAFPDQTYNATNYYVDVVIVTQ